VLEEYNPVLGYTYTFVSGDSNPTDRSQTAGEPSSKNVDTAWDPFLEAQGGGTIYNALFNLTNLRIHSVSLSVNPIEDVTTTVSWHGLWLDKTFDTVASTTNFVLINVVGNNSTVAIDNTKSQLGNEIDWNTVYDYTEDVQIGARFGWFIPGDVFRKFNDHVASQAVVHGNVNF